MSRYVDAEKIEYHEIYDGIQFVRVAYVFDIDNTPTADVVPKEIADEAYAHGYTEAESKYRAILERKRADAVEVVRCKDCKYYLHSNEKCELIDTRLHFYETDNTWTEDAFCAWGERREDEI